MKLRLVSFACVALALFCAPARPLANPVRVAGGLDSAPLMAGGFTADAPPIADESSIAYFNTLAQFKALTSLPAGVTHVYVRAVTGSYPPPAGADATPLWFRAASSATGVWGEVKVGGQIFDPVYSTNPVNIGEFGLVADGAWRQGGCDFSATSAGGETLTVSSTAGCVAGMRLTSVNWATRAAASLPIVPPGATISAVGSGKIAVSQRIPAMNAVPLAGWWDEMTGADNAPAIQAALDFGMRERYPNFKFPNGVFAVKSSLNAGWGSGYYTLNIKGGYRNSFAGLPGTVLLFTQFNQPFMNFQAVRTSGIAGVAIIGRNYNYLAYGQGRPSFSNNRYDWVAPEFSPASAPGGLQPNVPFAGVTEDAYCGGAPRVGYPDLSFPAWTNITTQFGKYTSSDVKLEDVEIDGFGVAYANGLGCASNADFTKIVNFTGANNAYDIAIVQSQSRNVELRNLNVEHFYAALTNSDFGLAQGQFNGPMTNIAAADGYEIFRFGNMAFAGPVVIDNIYGENIVRIGDFTGNAAFPNPVIFHGGMVDLNEFLHGQIPASYVTNNGPVTFSGVSINGNQRIGTWATGGGSVKFTDGGSWQCASVSPSSTAQLLAIDYSGGCLVGPEKFSIQDPVAATYYSAVGARFDNGPQQSVLASNATAAARVPMTQGLRQFIDQDNRSWNMTIPASELIDPASPGQVPALPAISNDVLTFGYCAAFQTMYPMAPGVIVQHNGTGTNFVVTSVGSPLASSRCWPATYVMVTATQQNNLNVVPGTNNFLSNNITAAALTGYSSRIGGPLITLPTRLFFGEFTSGDAKVAKVQDSNGSGAALTRFLAAGDSFVGPGNPFTNAGGTFSSYGANPVSWPIPPVPISLSAVTNGNPGSIVMSAPARSSGTFPIFPFELRP